MAVMWVTPIFLLCLQLVSGELENVALRKPTNVSSLDDLCKSSTGGRSCTASTGVDGDKTTYSSDGTGLMHTAPGHSSAWWTVDLEREVVDAEVKIYFRTDNTITRNGLQLYTSQTPFSSNPGGPLCHEVNGKADGTDIPDVVSVNCPGTWRHLMLYTNTDNDDDGPILNFSEVEILACTSGTYGCDCSKSCTSRHCVDPYSPCERYTGTCVGGCSAGWTGEDCMKGELENVALRKPTNVSSLYKRCQSSTGGRSCTASTGVDGDKTTNHNDETFLMHTAPYQPAAWWTVDLERDVVDAEVKIYFRTDNKYRRNGLKLYTSQTPFSSYPGGQLCHVISGKADGTDIPDVVSVNCPGTWRHLMLYTNTDNNGDGPVLDFSEVEVLACGSGRYGVDCSKSCSSRHCRSPLCERFTGACVEGCGAGWTGGDCMKECADGMFGYDCTSTCGKCDGDAACDHVTGDCPGQCEPGYRGRRCRESGDDTVHYTYIVYVLYAGVVGLIAVLVVVGLVICCLCRTGRLLYTSAPDNKRKERPPGRPSSHGKV